MLEGARILVTGGAGFIGSHLVERLLPRNHITVFDTFSRDALSSNPWADSANLVKVNGDVLNAEATQQVMEGHDYVIHCAAIAGVDTVARRPVETLRVNVLGSFNVLEAASKLVSCQRVVCFSTSEIFGPNAGGAAEADPAVTGPPGEPRWTYAAGKLVEEHTALAYHREFGLPAVVVRPFNVYGPRQVGEGAINNFTRRALRGEPLVIHGSGEQVRSWTYVSDMIDGVILALTQDRAIGEAYNIGNPESAVTTKELADLINTVTGSPAGIEFVDGPTAEIETRWPDIDKARQQLGFHPLVDLSTGISRTIEFLSLTLR